MTDRDPREVNRETWDERAAVHPDTDYYDVEGFLDGESSLYPLEREELADVVDGGTDLLHPMCHFGLDTLSWARECDEVVGVDFSQVAVERARSLAAEAGIENAEFVECDVLELDMDREFDVVFTSFGVLGWLDDLDAWPACSPTTCVPAGTSTLPRFTRSLAASRTSVPAARRSASGATRTSGRSRSGSTPSGATPASTPTSSTPSPSSTSTRCVRPRAP
ncbi:SAM-dependent methyltransferase [Halobacteriales archaeon QS_1_68_20]|nr:MAG: SAM-dependent methyltransferase [Halobacteriales archaeon QS_1_68_20]